MTTFPKMDGTSYSPQQELFELLQARFPDVFTEGKIDPIRLKRSLGEQVNVDSERYGLNWAGKSDCYRHIQESTTATLKPVRKESVDFDTTQNLFIEGDNLEVLKVLQKSYYGKVKMIYIDPPYNTGSDSFIYPDRFQESQDDYLKRIGEKDESGNLMRDGMFQKNSRDNGHYHSNWLSMMYPRLFLARNLLREDGVIFVSIDNNEVHNLRLVMDEIFGAENFIDCIIWKKRYGGGSKEKYLVSLHEYILFYSKDVNHLDPLFVHQDEANIARYYKYKDEKFETRGPYRTHPLEATKSMGDRKNLIYPIPAPDKTYINPQRQWLWKKERVEQALKNNELEFIKTDKGYSVHTKQYWRDESGEVRQSKMFSIIDNVYTQSGTNEIIELFGNAQIFSFPKPTALLKPLIQLTTDSVQEEIVLDFFAGSGTTAHAIIAQNYEDGGNRKYILVQLPEACADDSEAFKKGYKTIADVAKERIRRVGKEIVKKKQSKLNLDGKKIDVGFKVLELEDSNFKVWRGDVESAEVLLEQMEAFVDNTNPDAIKESVLYELILKSGLDLNVAVEKRDIGGKAVFVLNGGKLAVCLEDELNQAVVDAVVSIKPEKVLCLDKSFGGNDQLKTNAMLQMEQAKIDFKVV